MQCRICEGRSIKIKELSEYNSYLCQNCLLVQRIPLYQTHEERFISNEGYDWSLVEEKEFQERVKNKEIRWNSFIQRVPSKKIDTVLDFGSGYGPLLEYLKEIKIDAVGIEPSKKNSQISLDKGHKVINGYLSSNTFKEESFDIINICALMQYIPNIKDIFIILNKILKDDGYIFIEDKQSYYSTFNVLNNLKYELTAQYFSTISLKNLLSLTGFEVLYYRNFFGHFYLIARKSKKTDKLKGFYWLERIRVFCLPLTDFVFTSLKSILDRVYNIFATP